MKKFQSPDKIFTSCRMEQQLYRMQGVKMMREGFGAKHVAQKFGVSVRAVYGWVATFAEFGQNGLLAKEGAGRPPKLKPEQMRWIALTVRDSTPNQLKFEFGLWTLRLIGDLIEREFGMKLSKPTISRVMKQLGFTPQRPLRRAWEQDAVLVEKWRTTDLPALRAKAQSKGARLLFADAASMRSDYHAGTTWAPRGKTPIVKVMGQRRTVINMISAVGLSGEFEFMLIEGRGSSHVFKIFLEQLMLASEKSVILVVDGSPIHKAKIIKKYVESTKGMLELRYLPPYSPQLNPDEQLWKNVKERVAKQLPIDGRELRKLVIEALERLKNMPEIVMGFFNHPECGFVK